MPRILSLVVLLFSLTCIGCHAGGEEKCIYVSSSLGSDENPGTIERPLKSIASLRDNDKKHATIRLRCGDVFFEKIKGFNDCTIESYGKGAKPVVCGFRILRNIDAWVNEGNGLWKLDMRDEDDFAGFPLSLASDKKRFTDIGCMYDAATDSLFGHIVQLKEQLQAEGDIYLSDHYKNEDINEETFRYLTLKYSSDPRELGNVCFSVYEHGVSQMVDCTIRDIAIVGFGRHGMCGLNNCIVQNCDLDIIGGSIQTNTPRWVRYGNGIEFWISKNPIGNSTVSGCIISRTFDCGSTIQGSPKDLGSPSGIHFTGNKYIRCRQAFEHFLNSTTTEPEYIDCEFTGNISYMMGDNGFNSPEKRDADILSYENKAKYLRITGNEFFGGNYYCGHQKPEGMDGNKVYLFNGQYLVHYHGKKDFPTIYAEDEHSISEFREKWGDNSEIIILERDTKEARKLSKEFRKRIGYSTPDLKLDRLNLSK